MALAFAVGCKACDPLPDDGQRLIECHVPIVMTVKCDDLILDRGVIDCAQCFDRDEFALNAMVGGCYDYDHNMYCVAPETGCLDSKCRPSPVKFSAHPDLAQ